MKRILAALLVVVSLLGAISVFCSCGEKGEKVRFETAGEWVSYYTDAYGLREGVLYEERENPLSELDAFSMYRGNEIDLSSASVSEYALYFDDSTDEKDTEIGVFHLKPGVDANAYLAAFRARVKALLDRSVQYPFDTGALTDARFGTAGEWVYYVIVRDHAGEIESSIRISAEK